MRLYLLYSLSYCKTLWNILYIIQHETHEKVHLMNRQSGIVNLFVLKLRKSREVGGLHLILSLGGHRRARDLSPDLESVGHLLSVHGSR
jgi:hypothetical protein